MRPTGRQPELDTESPALCCYASEPHTRPDCGLTPVVAFGSTRLCASCAARRTRPSRRRTDSPNTRQLIHARIDILRAGQRRRGGEAGSVVDHLATILAVSYTHLRAHETRHDLVCRLLLEKKK